MQLISVILPNFNHAQYLVQRIESILNQTYQNFELIILDDCSTDNSKEIIEQYRDNPKVTYIIYNSENSGSPFKQWEKGINLASGEYIWIAESDDWADNLFLKSLVPILEKNTNVGLVYCDSVFEEKESSKLISEYFINRYRDNRWSSDFIHDGMKEISEILINGNTIYNVSSVLFRKSVFELVNPFDIPLRFSGDWYCYLKIASISDIAYYTHPLNHFRRHSSTTSSKAGFNYLIELFKIHNWINKKLQLSDEIKINGFFRYIDEVYDDGLNKIELFKELKYLYPLNRSLYYLLVKNKIKRKIKQLL